jgi:hypothetical protein
VSDAVAAQTMIAVHSKDTLDLLASGSPKVLVVFGAEVSE